MKTNTELGELAKQYCEGKTLTQLGMKTKDEARDALRKAMADYLDVLYVIGAPTGGPAEDFYDDNLTVPVCDYWNGYEWIEISVVPLEIAEEHRLSEKSQAIAAWKDGKSDSLEAWNLYATERKIQE